MPVITDVAVRAYAHCIVPACRGAFQEEVDALRVETSYLFRDNGGDIPGVERSKVEAQFVHDKDAVCPHCKSRRELSLVPRPSYQPLSGHDPLGLLNLPAFDPNLRHTPDDEAKAEMDAMRKQIAALTELVQKQAEGDD